MPKYVQQGLPKGNPGARGPKVGTKTASKTCATCKERNLDSQHSWKVCPIACKPCMRANKFKGYVIHDEGSSCPLLASQATMAKLFGRG